MPSGTWRMVLGGWFLGVACFVAGLAVAFAARGTDPIGGFVAPAAAILLVVGFLLVEFEETVGYFGRRTVRPLDQPRSVRRIKVYEYDLTVALVGFGLVIAAIGMWVGTVTSATSPAIAALGAIGSAALGTAILRVPKGGAARPEI